MKTLGARLLRHPGAMIGLGVLGLVVVPALAAPWLPLADPTLTMPAQRMLPAGSTGHPLGTDALGRDLLARLIWGARSSITVGVVAALVAALIGSLIGILAGFFGRVTDALLMRGVDVLMAFPYLLLALAIVAALGPGLANAMLAIALANVPFFARAVRGAVLDIRHQDYIDAARLAGHREWWIVIVEVLPNLIPTVLLLMTTTLGWMVLETAGLSFLGLGAQPPDADLGAMLGTGREFLTTYPRVAVLPGLVILVLVVGINLFGDALRDLLDPRLRDRGRRLGTRAGECRDAGRHHDGHPGHDHRHGDHPAHAGRQKAGLSGEGQAGDGRSAGGDCGEPVDDRHPLDQGRRGGSPHDREVSGEGQGDEPPDDAHKGYRAARDARERSNEGGPTTGSAPPLIAAEGLSVLVPSERGAAAAVDRLDLRLQAGERVGMVGESGSGKSLTALALLGFAPPGGRLEGQVELEGTDLLTLDADVLRDLRGRRIAYVPQEPSDALDPLLRVGDQLREAITAHSSEISADADVAVGEESAAELASTEGGSGGRSETGPVRSAVVMAGLGDLGSDKPGAETSKRVETLLNKVGLDGVAGIQRRFPHELSGGQSQRVAIAMALAHEPDLLIADEATTALDVTVQAEILALLERLSRGRDRSLLFVSHDLALVTELCDRVLVLYAGRVVEDAPRERLLDAPAHPYTVALLACSPELGRPQKPLPAIAGQPPSPAEATWGAAAAGCRFAPRCPKAQPVCEQGEPGLDELAPGHRVRCLFPEGSKASDTGDGADSTDRVARADGADEADGAEVTDRRAGIDGDAGNDGSRAHSGRFFNERDSQR
ncbi:MAG: ABC transporter permease subunit [Gammaproteobacteria bacterium]|jgi:peptide/nickel transport system permease protein|nr:ABC transporter permease subunit [Gammaproteobacteria bacterium]